MTAMPLTLTLLPGRYAVVRLDPWAGVPTWAAQGDFWAVARSSEQVTVVCPEDNPPPIVSAERGWRAFCVTGEFSLTKVGILESITHPLAGAGVSILIVSAYETAYVLVREADRARAVSALEGFGHRVAAG